MMCFKGVGEFDASFDVKSCKMFQRLNLFQLLSMEWEKTLSNKFFAEAFRCLFDHFIV